MAFSLRFKIIFITVAILVFAIGATTLASGYVFSQEYSNVLQSRAQIIAKGIESQLNKLLELGIPLEDLIGFEKQMRNTVDTYEDISYAMIVDLEGKILFHNDPAQHNKILTDTAMLAAIKSGEEVIQIYTEPAGQFYDVFIPIMDGNGAHIGAVRLGFPADLVTQKTGRLTTFSVIVALVSLGVAIALLIFLLSVWVTQPLKKLLIAIEEIRNGSTGLTRKVEIESRDEIGHLGSAFNTMTAQLHDLIDTLEERVADRTHRLEIVATLGEHLNAILDPNDLLREVVNQVQQNFHYYHTHIYLMDISNDKLAVVAGTGSAGQAMVANGHAISVNNPKSLVARVARTGKVAAVANVQEAENWLANPLLPETRTEMAVPIVQEDKVIGVLDVQADRVGALDDTDANLLRSLASQVAVALSNARLFEQTNRSKEEAESAKEKAEQAWQAIEAANQTLEVQMWQTRGLAQLNDRMRGEQDIAVLAGNIIQQLCQYLNAQVGTLYVREEHVLRLAGSYAYTPPEHQTNQFRLGESLVGQAALEKRTIVVNVSDKHLSITSSLGQSQPGQVLIAPFVYNNQTRSSENRRSGSTGFDK